MSDTCDPRSKYIVLYADRYHGIANADSTEEAVKILQDYQNRNHREVYIYIRADYALLVAKDVEQQQTKSELENLKQQRDQLETKIRQLQYKLAGQNKSGVAHG